MDFSQALTYLFKDPRWTSKLLMAALLSLIPVFGQAVVLGWSLGITRRVMENQAELLPDMDISNDLIRGLKAWGLGIIYLFPALLLASPMVFGLALYLASADGQTATPWLLTGLCLLAGLIAYGLLFSFGLPAIYGNFLAHDESFSAGLKIKDVYQLIRKNPIAYFLVMIGGFLCIFITLLGLAGCIIGVVATSLYTQTIMAHLYGQSYRSALARSAAPVVYS